MHNDLNVWSSLSSDLPVVYFVTLLRESVCSYRQWNNHCCLAPLGGRLLCGPERPDGVVGGDRWKRLMGVSTCHSSVPGQDDGWWVGSYSTPCLHSAPRLWGRGGAVLWPYEVAEMEDGGWPGAVPPPPACARDRLCPRLPALSPGRRVLSEDQGPVGPQEELHVAPGRPFSANTGLHRSLPSGGALVTWSL